MDVTHGRPSALLTHRVSVDLERQVVVKRYLRGTGSEALREWRALRLLAEHAPRLAPEPISADLDASPPSIVMSLLPGEPLGARPLEPAQGGFPFAVKAEDRDLLFLFRRRFCHSSIILHRGPRRMLRNRLRDDMITRNHVCDFAIRAHALRRGCGRNA